MEAVVVLRQVLVVGEGVEGEHLQVPEEVVGEEARLPLEGEEVLHLPQLEL